MQPQAFYRVVAEDFTAVDGIIRRQLTSRVPLVEKIGDYIISAGGKRLRPLLVLLAGKTLGYKGDDLCLLAATIEFLHTSTLLHDDVVVQQSGGVQEFDGGGQQAEVVALVAQGLAGEQDQQRTQALAAGGDDVVADLFHQGNAGGELATDDPVDGGEIFRHHAVEGLGLHQ